MKIPAIEPLTDGEERIMQMLWSLGEGTVNDILAVIPEPKPKYTTVATFIKILENKGYVAHRSEGKSIIRKSKCSTDFKRNDFLKKTKRTHWVRFVHLNSLIESCVFLYLWNSPFDTFL